VERKRVLVIDDDANWLETIKLMLETSYELEAATTSNEALDLVRRLRDESAYFDVAIVDQSLPNASGIALLTELRRIQPGLPCVILTGYAAFEAALEAGKSGAQGYLSKGESNLGEKLRDRIENAMSESPIASLIQQGEGPNVEFKSSARWDVRQNKVSTALQDVIVKAVASFLNSDSGGKLLVGVADNGNVLGLERDYLSLPRHDRDSFENFLNTLVGNALGVDTLFLIRIQFYNLDGKDVCMVTALPSPKPVYSSEGTLYIRTGNSSRPLNPREAVDYCSMRWKI